MSPGFQQLTRGAKDPPGAMNLTHLDRSFDRKAHLDQGAEGMGTVDLDVPRHQLPELELKKRFCRCIQES